MKNKPTTKRGAISAAEVCRRPKDRTNEDPSAHKPLMRRPRQSGIEMKTLRGAGGTFSQVDLFTLTQMFHLEEWQWLKKHRGQIAPDRFIAMQGELRARSHALLREVQAWMEREASL